MSPMPYMTVGFSRKTKWFAPFSWVIRATQWTPYSHVYVRYVDPVTTKQMVYQASAGMTHMVSWEHFRARNTSVYEFSIPVPLDMWPSLLGLMQSHLAVPYGWKQAAKMWWLDLIGSRRGMDDGTRHMVCSEAVTYLLMLLGYDVQREPDRMTPKHIFDLISGEHNGIQ